jgi:hypothetical protein
VSLLEKGNGMKNKFSSRPEVSLFTKHDKHNEDDETTATPRYDIGAPTVADLLGETTWDFVIVNDHTQSPARLKTKQASMEVLKNQYLPLLLQNRKDDDKEQQQQHPITTIIFIQTAAYKSQINNSQDLGNFDEFTDKLSQGYQEYANLINNNNGNGVILAKVAPVGIAVQHIKRNHCDGNDDKDNSSSLWAKLYARDDFHPSPLGTWLEACVLYCTITGETPPKYDEGWWETARYMQPPDEGTALPLPTMEEATLLADVAWKVCQQATKGNGHNHQSSL